MAIKRITLPIAAHTRMRGTPDGNGGKLWVAAGPSNEIADAVKAGGCHVMTNRGPRVILVDRVVKLGDGSLALVPIEVDFSEAKASTTTTTPVTDLSDAELAAMGLKRTAPVTSSGKANGARKTQAAKATTTSQPAAVKESAPAAAAVAEVDESELADLLVS